MVSSAFAASVPPSLCIAAPPCSCSRNGERDPGRPEFWISRACVSIAPHVRPAQHCHLHTWMPTQTPRPQMALPSLAPLRPWRAVAAGRNQDRNDPSSSPAVTHTITARHTCRHPSVPAQRRPSAVEESMVTWLENAMRRESPVAAIVPRAQKPRRRTAYECCRSLFLAIISKVLLLVSNLTNKLKPQTLYSTYELN